MLGTMTQSTERVYYQGTYNFTLEAAVLEFGNDGNGDYVTLNQTIFHPQGGGQPSDEGTITINDVTVKIKKLDAPRNPKEEPYVIKHYYEGTLNTKEITSGSKAILNIDEKARRQFAILHSAGHLLSNAVNALYPEIDGCNGNHFPGQCFVRFKGAIPQDKEFKTQVSKKVNEYVKSELNVTNTWNTETRTIQFGDLKAYPCGGTHVENSKEIGEIVIKSVKKEKQDFKISYDVKV